MDKSVALTAAQSFIREKQKQLNIELDLVPRTLGRISCGWAFTYQSRLYLESREFSQMLVGHGPTVIFDDGRILEGRSLDRGPDDVLRRHGICSDIGAGYNSKR